MEHHHLALAADTRRLVLDEEQIIRGTGEGVADQLVEGGVHGFRAWIEIFMFPKKFAAGVEAKTSRSVL